MLTGYRYTTEMPVRFRDLDAIGHMNNAAFLTFLEQARIDWWLATTRREGLESLDMILARTEIDYRSPVFMGETLVIGVKLLSIGRSSFRIDFRLVEKTTGRTAAEAQKVCVYYDFAASQVRPLPDHLRALLLEQDPDAATGG